MNLAAWIRHAATALTVVAFLNPGIPVEQQILPPVPVDRGQEHALILEIGRSHTPPPNAADPDPDPSTPDPPAPDASGDPGAPTGEIPDVWLRLADCESGNWIDGGASFEPRSARWDWAKPGTEVPPWGTRIHHGGLQFHPDTWTWVAPDVLEDPPTYAYDATPRQQVAVAVETQRRQGWRAWPVCSIKIGLR